MTALSFPSLWPLRRVAPHTDSPWFGDFRRAVPDRQPSGRSSLPCTESFLPSSEARPHSAAFMDAFQFTANSQVLLLKHWGGVREGGRGGLFSICCVYVAMPLTEEHLSNPRKRMFASQLAGLARPPRGLSSSVRGLTPRQPITSSTQVPVATLQLCEAGVRVHHVGRGRMLRRGD